VILIKNIFTLWGWNRFLLPVTYFPTNLVWWRIYILCGVGNTFCLLHTFRRIWKYVTGRRKRSAYIYLMGSEKVPSTRYILFDESSIPFFFSSGFSVISSVFLLSNGYLIVEVLDYSVLPCFLYTLVHHPLISVLFIKIICAYWFGFQSDQYISVKIFYLARLFLGQSIGIDENHF